MALLAGCATPQVAQLAQSTGGLSQTAELTAVPFYPQEDYQCGPASLAEVIAFNGIEASPEALVKEVYVPARQGSLQAEMLAAARRHGLVAYALAPRLADVLREVEAGTPVIVLANLAFDFAPVWHYAVVVGYDLPREDLVLRSGVTRRLSMTLSNFERIWARGGYWSMVAMPPGRVPSSADPDAYVSAIAALERIEPRSARIAYQAALARWPDHLVAQLGLGNAAYALGDLSSAEQAYRAAAERHPDSGDAWNNLAQAALEQGRRGEAIEAARRAVALGGPRLAQYRATLEDIERRAGGKDAGR